VAAQTPVSVWILFGVTDADQVRRDGTIQVRGGRITAIEPRRFEGTDAASSRGVNPLVQHGLIVNLSVPGFSAELDLTTAQTPRLDRPHSGLASRGVARPVGALVGYRPRTGKGDMKSTF